MHPEHNHRSRQIACALHTRKAMVGQGTCGSGGTGRAGERRTETAPGLPEPEHRRYNPSENKACPKLRQTLVQVQEEGLVHRETRKSILKRHLGFPEVVQRCPKLSIAANSHWRGITKSCQSQRKVRGTVTRTLSTSPAPRNRLQPEPDRSSR